jgi:hypothetical protein
MIKLKIEDKDNELLITEANMSVEEILFTIHSLIAAISKHTGISKEEVYQDIGEPYLDSWASK